MLNVPRYVDFKQINSRDKDTPFVHGPLCLSLKVNRSDRLACLKGE